MSGRILPREWEEGLTEKTAVSFEWRVDHGSLYEVKHWLRRAYRRKLLNEETVARLKNVLDELGPRLNAYLKSIGTNRVRNRPTET